MGASLDELDIIGRLLLAAALGGALGIEREFDGQDAGFRTHLLVVLGSALFGMASVGAFDDFDRARNDTNITLDLTRIASYVAPGIGFIGGGAILKYGGRVTGITTAASLWTAAAIGVSVGLGFWLPAVVTTVVGLAALEALQPVSRFAHRTGARRRAALALDVADAATVERAVAVIREECSGEIRTMRFGMGPDGGQLTLQFWRPPSSDEMHRMLVRLAALEGVRDVVNTADD